MASDRRSAAYKLPPEVPRGELPPDDDRYDADDVDGRMSFIEHLEELRKRIIYACIAVAVGMGAAFFFVDRIFTFVFSSTQAMLPPGSKLIYTQPGEAFSLYISIALIAGVILASPVIMYQVWLFIAPGLYSNEKRFVIPFVLLTTIGVVTAAAFSHYLMFPYMIAFFGTFSSPLIDFMPRIADTFDLYTKTMMAMMVVFQIPTLVFFLAKMGIVNARFLWQHKNYAVLISFIAAAILTPSGDPWNLTLFAAPIIVLYMISIGIAWLVGREAREA
jgi:sec-independent protein translocase protein TatC